MDAHCTITHFNISIIPQLHILHNFIFSQSYIAQCSLVQWVSVQKGWSRQAVRNRITMQRNQDLPHTHRYIHTDCTISQYRVHISQYICKGAGGTLRLLCHAIKTSLPHIPTNTRATMQSAWELMVRVNKRTLGVTRSWKKTSQEFKRETWSWYPIWRSWRRTYSSLTGVIDRIEQSNTPYYSLRI